MRLARSELVRSLTTDASGSASGTIGIVPDSFPVLAQLFKSFEKVRWLSFRVFYKPAVGTTVGGLITYGIDWDRKADSATTRQKVAAYTPSHTQAIWADNELSPMIIPPSRLQLKLWYTPDQGTPGPGSLVYRAEGPKSTVVGEIWVHYSVILAGTRAA